MMNKNVLTIVGIVAFIGIGYYLWQSSNLKDKTTTGGGVPTPKSCNIDEYEQEIECLVPPCPTICVKKKRTPLPDMSGGGNMEGFTGLKSGESGSFFNPKIGRSQDTSF